MRKLFITAFLSTIACLLLFAAITPPSGNGFGNDENAQLYIIEGAASTDFLNDRADTDENRTITVKGNPVWVSGSGLFGKNTMHFDGTGDTIDVDDSSDWDLGSGDFTIDFWAKFTDFQDNGAVIGQVAYNNANDHSFVVYFESSNKMYLDFYDTGPSRITDFYMDTNGLTDNKWTHVAVVKDGVNITFYADGVNTNTFSTFTHTIRTVALPLAIGGGFAAAAYNASANIAEMRLSKGVVRWRSNFTPPNRGY